MNENKTSISTHLQEIRARIIKILLVIMAGFLGCYFFSENILNWLRAPYLQKLVFISPTEAFIANLKISFASATILALPFILFQIWRFIAPGLKSTERRFAFSFVIWGSLLFFTGIIFASYIVLPLGIKFLLSYAGIGLTPMISIQNYLSFCMVFLLIFGLIFNVPLFTVLLTKMGLINHNLLSKNKKYAVLIIFTLSAILTPPDIFTQLVMGVPLLILYEISLCLSRFFQAG